MRMRKKVIGLLVTTLLLFVGCAEKQTDTIPKTDASTQTDTNPKTDASTQTETSKTDSPFKISVLPQELKGFSISGQSIHYLVTISEDAAKDPVTISASSTGADVTVVQKDIVEGQVAEVVAVPKAESIGKTVELSIEGKRGAVVDSKTMTFDVIEGVDDRRVRAEELLEPFINFLAETHPEFKITKDTKWTGTMVSPQWLVVSHYLFFSEEWELHLEWHIMIAPDDWVRIDLRHRLDETKPSAAFEISSISAGSKPIPIEVPTEIWR